MSMEVMVSLEFQFFSLTRKLIHFITETSFLLIKGSDQFSAPAFFMYCESVHHMQRSFVFPMRNLIIHDLELRLDSQGKFMPFFIRSFF